MKILFFDSWTGGIHNFTTLASRLRERGIDSLLVHRGSWGDDPGRPLEETIGGLLCRDIRYYGTNLIYKVFAREKPDAVVILTTRTFIDRSVISSARALGIRSYYLMHGAIFVGEKHEGHTEGMQDTLHKQRWDRAMKYLRLILPNYFYSGTRLSATFPFRAYPYQIIWKTFSDPAEYYWAPPAHPELQCDRALVWAEAYRPHIHRAFGYPLERIEVVGPPPLDATARLLRQTPPAQVLQEFFERHRVATDRPLVVYLETPAVESGIAGWTRASRLEHFDEIIDIVWKAGRRLVVKLHPSSEFESLKRYDDDERVRFLRVADLPMLVYGAQAVIGFVSTTLDIPIVLGKAILTPTWGISASMPRDFIDNGVASPVGDAKQLANLLTQPAASMPNKTAIEKYIADFITLTDGRAIERICEALMAAPVNSSRH